MFLNLFKTNLVKLIRLFRNNLYVRWLNFSSRRVNGVFCHFGESTEMARRVKSVDSLNSASGRISVWDFRRVNGLPCRGARDFCSKSNVALTELLSSCANSLIIIRAELSVSPKFVQEQLTENSSRARAIYQQSRAHSF